MAQALTTKPNHIEDLAEGRPQGNEYQEPDNPLATTNIPSVPGDVPVVNPAAETGLIAKVNLVVEGRDDDNKQDASLTAGESDTSPSPSIQRQTMSDTKTPTVLIIEDTTELAEIIQATLERMNMRTHHVTHGEQAIDTLKSLEPDVILLDISLPDMTGWKILELLKEQHENEHKPRKMPMVIVITAYGDPANRLVGKLQGVFSYLIKPFTTDEVEKMVTQALNSSTL